jgi:transmembrane sensor
MTEQVLSPSAHRVARDEAAQWLAHATPGARPEADQAFAEWLARSPANREAWSALRQVWSDFDDTTDPLIGALRAEALCARPPRRRTTWAPTAIAASLLIALGGGAGWWATRRAAAPAIPAQASADIVAAEVTTTALPDGTRATLDAGSALALTFDGRQRATRLLRGRVFLTIALDPARPFLLEAGDRRITDLGTSFETVLAGDQVTVTLTEGAVTVTGGEKAVTLKPGETLSTFGRQDEVRPVSLAQTMTWRQTRLEFSETALADALAQINRFGGAPARAPDPQVAKLKVTGAFTSGDPSRFALSVAEMHGLRTVRRRDGGIDILPAP